MSVLNGLYIDITAAAPIRKPLFFAWGVPFFCFFCGIFAFLQRGRATYGLIYHIKDCVHIQTTHISVGLTNGWPPRILGLE